MAILGRYTMQPGETLDFDVSYDDWFTGRADTYLSHVAVVEAGLVLVGSIANGNVIKCVVKPDPLVYVNGQRYKVTVRLTTTSGIVKEADFYITVKEV